MDKEDDCDDDSLQPVAYKRYHAQNPPLPFPLSQNKFKLAAAIMMRDEAPYIGKTIDSAAPHVDCFVCADTGSVDNSVEVVQSLCKKWQKPCFIVEFPFIEYGPSRNHLMHFVERVSNLALLMDSSDELRGGEFLKEAIRTKFDMQKMEAATLRLQWNTRCHSFPRLVNTRFKLRYKDRRHNYLEGGAGETIDFSRENFFLFQDRTKSKSSANKFKRDAEVILEDHLNDPTNTRHVYYLAQSYRDWYTTSAEEDESKRDASLARKAYEFYKKRKDMDDGYKEEMYSALVNCGDLAIDVSLKEELGLEVAKRHYLDAFEILPTPECAVALHRVCRDLKKKNEAHAWIIAACTLPSIQMNLDENLYERGPKRWWLYGRSALLMGYGRDAINAYAEGHAEFLKLCGDTFGGNTNNSNKQGKGEGEEEGGGREEGGGEEVEEEEKEERGGEEKEKGGEENIEKSNSDMFDDCWHYYGKSHPEWFTHLPREWLSDALLNELYPPNPNPANASTSRTTIKENN